MERKTNGERWEGEFFVCIWLVNIVTSSVLDKLFGELVEIKHIFNFIITEFGNTAAICVVTSPWHFEFSTFSFLDQPSFNM
jgi:hypothetical protein